jgi:hypothetical protein
MWLKTQKSPEAVDLLRNRGKGGNTCHMFDLRIAHASPFGNSAGYSNRKDKIRDLKNVRTEKTDRQQGPVRDVNCLLPVIVQSLGQFEILRDDKPMTRELDICFG